MKDRISRRAAAILAALLAMFTLTPALAGGSVQGRLSVGIIILATCHIRMPDRLPQQPLPLPTGLQLTCARGITYGVHTQQAPSQIGESQRQGVSVVTIDF